MASIRWRQCGASALHSHSQFDTVVRRIHKILLRAKVSFGGLDGRVAEQQLNLLKLSACRAA